VFAEHLPRLLPITRDMFALHVRWNRMALAMVSLLALYGAWQVFGWPASHRTLIGDLFFFPVGFAAMWAAACAGRCCALISAGSAKSEPCQRVALPLADRPAAP